MASPASRCAHPASRDWEKRQAGIAKPVNKTSARYVTPVEQREACRGAAGIAKPTKPTNKKLSKVCDTHEQTGSTSRGAAAHLGPRRRAAVSVLSYYNKQVRGGLKCLNERGLAL